MIQREVEGQVERRNRQERILHSFIREQQLEAFPAVVVAPYLSHGIDVPPEHVEEGLVTATFDAEGAYFDWARLSGDLLRVSACKHRPKHATVAVRHLGYWFYINDDDLQSKSTFKLLMELNNLEIRGAAGRQLHF